MHFPRNSSPMSNSRGGRRSCRTLYLFIATILFFLLFVYTPLPITYSNHRDTLVQHVTGARPDQTTSYPSLATTRSKYVYATFLAGDDHQQTLSDINQDNYFVAVRILAYQILHAPETRSPANYPFIVLVTHLVTEPKRQRLRQDGAIVIEAETITKPSWIEVQNPTWQDVFDKLRLWELVQFERIAFLDGDTLLTRPLDAVFSDPAAATQQTNTTLPAPHGSLLPALPKTFTFASTPEMLPTHTYPPTLASYPNKNYLNAGFFLLAPCLTLLDYYLALLSLPDSFTPTLPEQNLLNEVHSRDGPMPWSQVAVDWNMHYPTQADLDGGVATLHEKFWSAEDEEVGKWAREWKGRMEGFWVGREGLITTG